MIDCLIGSFSFAFLRFQKKITQNVHIVLNRFIAPHLDWNYGEILIREFCGKAVNVTYFLYFSWKGRSWLEEVTRGPNVDWEFIIDVDTRPRADTGNRLVIKQ